VAILFSDSLDTLWFLNYSCQEKGMKARFFWMCDQRNWCSLERNPVRPPWTPVI